MEIYDKFREIFENRHEYAKAWKERTGGKIVAHICTYTPREIIHAAGMLPVRVFGGHEPPQDMSSQHMSTVLCPFSHDALAQALRGRYNYANGIVIARSCDHAEQTWYNWKHHVPTELAYYIFMPANIHSPRALPLLTKEYVDFKHALEQLSGKTISDEGLDRAIELHNTNRRLMKEIWELRKKDVPAITGAEAMDIVLAGQVMDIAEHNRLLEELIKQLPSRKISQSTGIRLMLTGGENDDTSFVRFVEEQLGATVVIAEHCAETRYFWDEVIPSKNRLDAIARRYIERWPCPTTDWKEGRRMSRILQLAKDYRVEAAILYQQKFCDPHEFANPVLQEILQGIGIPCLRLEFDVIIPVGQFRTRVEAFFEQITLQII